VAAGRAVRLGGVGARARTRVAGAGDVALIRGRADLGVGASAHSALAGVGLRAGVAVAAGRAVGRRGVGAGTGRGVAGARYVALIRGRADLGVGASAHSALAFPTLRAGVPVAAGRAVRLGGVGARARTRVAGAG